VRAVLHEAFSLLERSLHQFLHPTGRGCPDSLSSIQNLFLTKAIFEINAKYSWKIHGFFVGKDFGKHLILVLLLLIFLV
jgi:hypothetical protein